MYVDLGADEPVTDVITKFHAQHHITLVIPNMYVSQTVQNLVDMSLTGKSKSKTHQHSPSHDQQR